MRQATIWILRQSHHGFLVPDLGLLAAIEAAQGSIIVPGQAEGDFDQDGPQQRVAVFADAAVAERLAGLDDGHYTREIAGGHDGCRSQDRKGGYPRAT